MGLGQGKKAGACGNTPPAKRSYFVVSRVGVEVGASGFPRFPFSGGFSFLGRDRPRKGFTPNFTSTSESGPKCSRAPVRMKSTSEQVLEFGPHQLETDRLWYERMRDAYLKKLARG